MMRGARSIAAKVAILGAAICGAAVAIATPLHAQTASSTFTLWPKWGPFLDLGGQVGTKRNIGEATLFVPVWQDERAMLFGDFRFKADDQDSHEGNFGLGFRKMLGEGWNAGLYGFYDHRRTSTANLFNQFTVGAELLGTNFDFRVNTYWPFGNTQQPVGVATTGPSTASVSGSTLVVSTPATMQTYEYALRGFDAEAGARIPITPAQSPYNLRFYAGAYRFDDPTGVAQVVAGPRLRLEFTDYDVQGLWGGTRFTVSTEWQTDQVRGSQFFAGLRLRVPLQAEPRRSQFTMQERRMTDTIIRDVDIVANAQTIQIAPAITENAVSSGGKTVTAISSATTSGTGLATAVTGAGGNAYIVLQGTFNTGTTQIALSGGQTLMGSGTATFTTTSGRSVTASLPGATINSTRTGTTIVQPTDNTTVSGLTINGTGSGGGGLIGIQPNNTAGNITISNNTVTLTQTGANTVNGIGLSANTNVTVSGNTVSVTGIIGQTAQAFIAAATSSATVSGNSFSASGGTTNRATSLTSTTIFSGSTGNVKAAGVCNNGGGNTGSISFTDGTTCP